MGEWGEEFGGVVGWYVVSVRGWGRVVWGMVLMEELAKYSVS